MKNKKFPVVGGLIGVALLFFFVGCGEKEQCATYTFINSTSHMLSLKAYNPHYHWAPDESFGDLLAGESVNLVGTYCTTMGAPALSFSSIDSVFLFFDDTLKVILFSDEVGYGESIYGDSIFLADDGWVKVKSNKKGTMHNFEYEFTDWHYQKALEAHGYVVK